MLRADQHDVADVRGDQLDPAEDERAHEDLARARIGLDEREQPLPAELDASPASAALDRTSAGRPASMLTSPVNAPGRWTVISVSEVG